MSQNKNFSILPFYDNRSKQNHFKWWNYGKAFKLICEVDTLPPFQIQKELTGQGVSALVLVNCNDDSEIDILAKANTAGLTAFSFTDYDLIVYPSTVILGIDNITQGSYYLRITSAGETFYSEIFSMCQDVSDLIKIEFYHSSKFCFPNGHIEYTHPYKNRLYIPSDIAKPSVEYEEQVIKREGVKFAVQQITYKMYHFNMFAPEYLIDILQLIRLHDFVDISYSGYYYDVDEILMTSPKWLEQGNLAVVEFEFKTDTIVVSNARGVTDLDYSAPDGSCIIVDYNCVSLIEKDSVDYNNFQYTPSDGGQPIPFEQGDNILIFDSVANRIEYFIFETSPNLYEQQNLLPSETSFDSNNDKYYFAASNETDNFVEPFITSVTNSGANGLAFGESFENTVAEIWVRYTDGNGIIQEEKRGQGLSEKLKTTGVPFTWDDSIIQVRIKVSSAVCPLFSFGAWFIITALAPTGIGSMEIGLNFIIS